MINSGRMAIACEFNVRRNTSRSFVFQRGDFRLLSITSFDITHLFLPEITGTRMMAPGEISINQLFLCSGLSSASGLPVNHALITRQLHSRREPADSLRITDLPNITLRYPEWWSG